MNIKTKRIGHVFSRVSCPAIKNQILKIWPSIGLGTVVSLAAVSFLFAISRRAFVTIPYFDRFMTTGDMLKHFGIVFWLVFFYRTTRQEVSALWKTSRDSAI